MVALKLRPKPILIRMPANVVLLGVALWFLGFSGCQGFTPKNLLPFGKRSQQNTIVQQWTSGGEAALEKGRLEQAESLLTRASQERPDDHRIRTSLAETLRRQGQTQAAIDQMRIAVESSKAPKARVELANMLLDSGKWIEANRHMQLALKKNRQLPEVWELKARTEMAQGNWQQAIYDYQRSLSLNPDQPNVQMQVANAYMQTAEPLRALSAIEQLLDRYPTDQQPETALVAKSNALVSLDQLPKAIEVLQMASQRSGASSEVFLRLSQVQLAAGQASQARTTLAKAKISFPNQPVFDSMLQQLREESGQVATVQASDELPELLRF